MKKKTVKILKIVLPLLLGVFLIWYSYSKFTPDQLTEIKDHFKNANYWFLLLSLLFGFFSHLSRAYRWNFMLEPLGYKPKLANNAMAVFIAYLFNLAIPRSGEVSRALVINKYDNVPFDKAFGTIVAERIADVLVLGFIVLLAFALQFDALKDFLLEIIPIQKLLIAGITLTLLGIAGLFFIYKTNFKISLKIRKLIAGLKEGLLAILKMKKVWPFIFHTVFIWIMYVAMFYICIFALEETSSFSFSTVITAFVVGSFAIAFTNGGFGSYPFFIAEILLLFGISATVGTAFGWIVWISQFVMILLFGGLSLLLLPVYNRNK
ncbi:hypothetical protein SAMN04487906_1593 [Zhouia amylolytica]|uniref:Lysylphosphatidylglycerol synthase TM region n=1 Tax=Zhouia amylolytica TaxID=376730 RepID=A0A1I6SG92_9FLAO|nr:lysylphosphatidylglycerol synthase transmembrane domain-containing protein [Zhouia amylolytica]SFS75934.1 hypothetical protein SAMN04487906_1593 [Zhouia amylolytica]